MTQDRRKTLASVYVADDHPVFRKGIVRLLDDAGLDVIGESGDGKTALRDIKRLNPTVAILDVQMPELDGVRVLEALRLEKMETQVVLLSGFFDSEIVFEAVTCGVASLITKTSGYDDITKTVIAAARGETTISPELMGGLAKELRRRKDTDPLAQPLTNREADVLRLIAKGLSRKEMARDLDITLPTVKYHISGLYSKLGVVNATAAVAEAMRRGLVE